MPTAKKPTRARRDADKQKRREDILDAAERVIAKLGLKAANYGNIAKQSRLSRTLLYVYFPTREDLIYGVCERALHALQARFEAVARQEKTGLDQVIGMGRAYKAFSEEQPLYFQVISEMETKQVGAETLSSEVEGAMNCGRAVVGRVATAVAAGIKDGSIAADAGDPVHTALAMWSFTHGLIQVSHRKGAMLQHKFNVSAEHLVEHGFRTLRASLASHRSRRT
jgi:AcrR family transcriptional regulator